MTSASQIGDLPLVVMCGGRGARLRPTTDLIPKALVPVNGRPVIDYVIDFFASAGTQKCFLSIGYRGDQIREHFADRQTMPSIAFSDCGESASILQRLYALREEISDRFIVAYCDTFIDIDLPNLLRFHEEREAPVTLVTAPIQSPFGLVDLDGTGIVEGFVEKPVHDYFIGCFVVERRLFDDGLSDDVLSRPDGDGLVALLQDLASRRALAAYRHNGLNITFNTDSELARAEQQLEAFFTLRETNGS